jgi:hypothetical protein
LFEPHGPARFSLGRRPENRTEPDVGRTAVGRRHGLFEVVGGNADKHPPARQPERFVKRQVVLAQVDRVCIAIQRHLERVVHNKGNAGPPRQCTDQARGFQQPFFFNSLEPKLEGRGSTRKQGFGQTHRVGHKPAGLDVRHRVHDSVKAWHEPEPVCPRSFQTLSPLISPCFQRSNVPSGLYARKNRFR